MQKINTKNKNKKFIFFRSKLGQEIQLRKNPEISGKSKQSSQKIFHFLKDFHSLTPAVRPWNNH